MNKRDFIGKVVISANTKKRYVISKIHPTHICVESEQLNQYGTSSAYMLNTDNGDPFTSGDLYFEDAALTERFKKEYKEYCRSEDGRSESWMDWMLTGD